MVCFQICPATDWHVPVQSTETLGALARYSRCVGRRKCMSSYVHNLRQFQGRRRLFVLERAFTFVAGQGSWVNDFVCTFNACFNLLISCFEFMNNHRRCIWLWGLFLFSVNEWLMTGGQQFDWIENKSGFYLTILSFVILWKRQKYSEFYVTIVKLYIY